MAARSELGLTAGAQLHQAAATQKWGMCNGKQNFCRCRERSLSFKVFAAAKTVTGIAARRCSICTLSPVGDSRDSRTRMPGMLQLFFATFAHLFLHVLAVSFMLVVLSVLVLLFYRSALTHSPRRGKCSAPCMGAYTESVGKPASMYMARAASSLSSMQLSAY